MKRIILTLWILAFMFLGIKNIGAQTKPTPEAAKSVLAFYFNGQGNGVVLADVMICTEIENNECVDNVPVDSLKKESQYYLWMLYIVPSGDEVDGIIIQFNKGGITRFTRDVSVSGSIRYRTWKTFTLNQLGEWEVKILHDRGESIETLQTLSLTVNG